MDETSWRLALLKAGINITNIDFEQDLVYFDFAYRPNPGGPRVWGKSVAVVLPDITGETIVSTVKEAVLNFRKELEQ